MAHRPQRLGALAVNRPILTLGFAVSVILGGCLLWKTHLTADRAAQTEILRTYTVRTRPVASTVGVVGTIVPGDSANVVVPFDGVVQQANIDYGRAVVAGQVLLVMDPFELEQRRREAEVTYLKAEEADANLAAWNTGPEMSRARRAVTAAERELQATKRKAAETKSLLDRGLVARVEYDALVQQETTETTELTAAREDLATVQKQGEGSSRKISAIVLQDTRARLADLTAQLSGATVRAPASGIIVRPPAEKSDQDDGSIHAGQHLVRGQLIGTIAKPDRLAVAIKLDEADANRVREGQTATVTGPGFPGLTLSGRVTRIAGEGTAGDSDLHGSLFAAMVRIDPLEGEQARVIRIGMNANVEITLYRTPSTTTIPPEAVQGTPPLATVRVQDAQSGLLQTRNITIGAVAPDAVEVLSGVSAGDVVVWPDSGSGGQQGQP